MRSRQVTESITLSDLLHHYESLDDAYSEARTKMLRFIRSQTVDLSPTDVVICTYRVGKVRNTMIKVEKGKVI